MGKLVKIEVVMALGNKPKNDIKVHLDVATF